MKFRPVAKMDVDLDLEGAIRRMGTLAWSTRERLAYFEFTPEFLAKPLLVSPFHLPVRSGPRAADSEPFQGLHGLFNDSLPDGWGRLLVDRRLGRMGLGPQDVTPLDRLSAVGTKGMGALAYTPQLAEDDRGADDLDWFVEQVELVQKEMDTAEIDALQGAQGGSAGARPKIMIGLGQDGDAFVIDYGDTLKPGFEPWMVKSRSMDDRPDIGIEEQAYALMARAAGLEMADTKILRTEKGNALFATKRFDRTPQGRLHMHTASGLLYADHRQAAIDYGMLHKLTAMLTRDEVEVRRTFCHMVFNIYSHNRDDHAKNHAFLMGADGRWRVSPAYDLTYSSGPGGEHSLAIAGEGRDPGREHILQIAKDASIAPSDAGEIIDRVRAAVDRWPEFADEAGLSRVRTDELDLRLNGVRPAPSVDGL